jgi:phosphatidylinositol alpha 1,6-mannosyltransferase
MRLVIVTESFLPRVNGVTRAVEALIARLRERGDDALIFAAGPGPFEHQGYPVVRVMGVTGVLYPDLTIAPLAPGMGAMIDDFAPDLMHLASPAALGVYAARVARRRGIPVAAHYQTDLVAYAQAYAGRPVAAAMRRLERRFHNHCTVTYAPSEPTATSLRQRGVDNVRVSGRGVDTLRFRPDRPGATAAARLWPDGEGPRLLCVARLAREKGLDRLVEQARMHPRLRILVVGDGPCRRSLEASAPANVRFSGLLDGDDLADAYAAGQVFVYPSLTETFGQVVQEAMASGLPVAGVAAGGVASVIDAATGVLVPPPGDALLDSAAEVCAAEPRRRALGDAARSLALTRSWPVVLDSLLDEYAALIAPTVATTLAPRRQPARAGRRRAAFFDVDRTLLRGSSVLALAGPLRRAGILSIAALARATVHQLRFTLRGTRTARLGGAAQQAAAAMAGHRVVTVQTVARRAMARCVLPRVYSEARAAIAAHRRAGDLVFLVSSAPEELVAHLVDVLGLDGCTGTQLEVAGGCYTGRITTLCYGSRKRDAVVQLARAHRVDLARSVAYGDSLGDLEMLESVGTAICVNPDRALRAAAAARGWHTVAFTGSADDVPIPDADGLERVAA